MTRSRLRRRVSEIGIRRAFGCTRGRIVADILAENFVITLAGGLSRLLLCIGFGALLFDAIYSTVPWTHYAMPSTLSAGALFDWTLGAYALLFCFILNLISTGVPALRASRINPVEAINQKNDMKRKLLRQTLNEWRANVWLIVEMIIVSAIVWYINDYLYVHVATRLEPTSFDTSHTYMAEFRYLPEGSRRYTDYGEATTERNRADLLSIIEAIRQRPDVEGGQPVGERGAIFPELLRNRSLRCRRHYRDIGQLPPDLSRASAHHRFK